VWSKITSNQNQNDQTKPENDKIKERNKNIVIFIHLVRPKIDIRLKKRDLSNSL
jgi:hypothetical protein